MFAILVVNQQDTPLKKKKEKTKKNRELYRDYEKFSTNVPQI